MRERQPATGERNTAIDVSIVMPCLDEVLSLAVCIEAAFSALNVLRERHGLTGEVVIADNGSTDGSQALAMSLGARVVPVIERGYGAALRHGFAAAGGRFLVMGDADGSYDFRESVAMVEALMRGAGLCMGSRFKGGIRPGAMPWKNRYIGNPVLTGILNLLFRTGVSDAHCGLRALTRPCFERLGLTGSGMEFASEMVIKAALKREVIAEVPATLSPDLRDRPPHLRPWRDGWRHLRYLFMLSPAWLFAVPAMLVGSASLTVLAIGGWFAMTGATDQATFGNYWVILAGAMFSLSHMASILALAGRLYGVREGYRLPGRITTALSRWLSLEVMLVTGALSIVLALLVLGAVTVSWSQQDFQHAYSVFPVVIGTLLLTLGGQNVFGGFILAIIGGNQAKFLQGREQTPLLRAAGASA